ncbi:MAG: hypothetical protein HQL37_11060 [Alphaproteobacteria bacterium]|nr:hypothetical protein [Alphaproteobacteria bacterium]
MMTQARTSTPSVPPPLPVLGLCGERAPGTSDDRPASEIPAGASVAHLRLGLPLDFIDDEFAEDLVNAAHRMRLKLFKAALKQIPAGSLPNNQRALCRLAGCGDAFGTWRYHRRAVMADWGLYSDDRYHHPVLEELVLRALDGERRAKERAERDAQRKQKQREAERRAADSPPSDEEPSDGYSATVSGDSLESSVQPSADVQRDTALTMATTTTTVFLSESSGSGCPEPPRAEAAPAAGRAKRAQSALDSTPVPSDRPADSGIAEDALLAAFSDAVAAELGERLRPNSPDAKDRAAARDLVAAGATAEVVRTVAVDRSKKLIKDGKRPRTFAFFSKDMATEAARVRRLAAPSAPMAPGGKSIELGPGWPEEAAKRLVDELDETVVRQWFKPDVTVVRQGPDVRVLTPSKFARNWLQEHYEAAICRVLGVRSVTFAVGPTQAPAGG